MARGRVNQYHNAVGVSGAWPGEGLSQWEFVAPVGVTRGVASWVGEARGGVSQ